MDDGADGRRHPQDAHIGPADRLVVEREQERRAGAGDHEEDVRIVDAYEDGVDELREVPMPEVQRRAHTEQQHDGRAVDADADLHPSRRGEADEDDRCGDRERERDQVQPSAQFRLRAQDLLAFAPVAEPCGALFLLVEFLRRDRLLRLARLLVFRAWDVVDGAMALRNRPYLILPFSAVLAGHASSIGSRTGRA